MDWQTFTTTFVSVFLAEFGDKTQLATLAFAGDSRRPWTVFAASALALTLAAGLGAFFGGTIARWIPPHWLRRGAALLFVGIGAWMLVREWRE